MPSDYVEAINAARAVQSLPDGSPIDRGPAHLLLVLATRHPNIWPGQRQLALDVKASRRSVNRWLDVLENAGLVWRHRRGRASTLYELRLGTIRKCSKVPSVAPEEQTTKSKKNDSDGDGWVPSTDEELFF